MGLVLEYNEEVHLSVENSSPRQGYYTRQWLVIANKLKRLPQVRVSRRPSFLSKGLRLSKKLDLRRTPPTKSVTY